MTRFRCALLLLGLLHMTIAPATASDADFTLKCQSVDRFLEVYSDHAVDAARCEAIVARVLKAFAFVTARAAWKDRSLLTARPLQFALVGDGAIRVLGYAKGPNLMVMKDSYMDNPLSEGTLAHELTHVQDFRQLRGKQMPSFMFEGRALTIGQAYRIHVGQAPGDYDRQMARSAADFTAEQAMELLETYHGHGWNNQAIGTVVVEYMRTRWKGGVADINSRLSRMIERIADGRDFEQAFQDEFGDSAEAFADAFTGFLRATQNDPRQRLQGTMWQSVGIQAASTSSQDTYVSDVVDLIGDLLR
jgi:hypothetical protein